MEESVVLESVRDPSISDPLSEVTRKERKALLVASLIAVAIAKGGLIPKEIQALDITLSPAEILSLLYLIALALVYLLVGFYLYASSDLRQRKVKIESGRAKARPAIDAALAKYKERTAASNLQGKADFDIEELVPLGRLSEQTRLATEVLRFSGFRVFFEFHLPLIIGTTALAFVLVRTKGFPGWLAVVLLAVVASIILTPIYLYRRRQKIVKWFKVRRHRWYMRRVKRGTEKLKKIDPNSPQHARFQAKLRALLEKTLEGPWV